MHRQELLQLLNHYDTEFMEERAMVARTRQYVSQHSNCFDRELRPAHITGSAWVLNPAWDHALMLHHRKLDMWLQPGGHADGDHDMLRVVLKETQEESGIALDDIQVLSTAIFDVDIHTVFDNEHFDRHDHFDIRFLLQVDDALPIPGNDESHQVRWIPLEEVSHFNNVRSLYRMVEKTRRLQRRYRMAG